MKISLLLLIALFVNMLTVQCTQQQMQRQVFESRTVVLDIGHYYAPGRGGQGARTPDATQGGALEECEFWYKYAGEVKNVIERSGYKCLVINRGDTPTDPALATAAKRAGVIQVRTPQPTAVYLSRHHPKRMAVGMLSADYALDWKPAAVIFLHLNSDSDTWRVSNKGAFYCNKVGVSMAIAMAEHLNRTIFNRSMPNGGFPCGVIVRTDGHKGGGDWLNTCNDSWVPALITEVAFLSNPLHARFLNNPDNARSLARSIGEGAVRYLRNR